MFNTIALALDGSEGSKRAVSVATELAQEGGGRIVVAHVEQDVAGKGGAPIPATEDEIQAGIRKLADELSSKGIETTVQMRNVMVGGPAPAIEEIADKADADLIVVGTHGHSAAAGVILGSVTQRLLHVSRRPILAIPPPA
jgi:nucleotide-binding universal stress UspA family protein